MPAAPSSPIPAALVKLGPLHQHDTGRLRAHLQRVPDPRSRRGRWYPLVSLLLICACAVVSGARTITEITEWGQRATTTVLEQLGIRRHLPGRRRAPSHATLTRPLDTAIGAYLAERDHTDVGTTGSAPRPAIAVDGKALSGSAHRTQRHRHLLSAVTHAPTVTLAQREVGAKTNETAAFRPLLEPLDLAGTVVTFDALHSVKDQVRWLVQEKKAHYIAVIKGKPADRVDPGQDPAMGAGARGTHRLRNRARPAGVPLDQDHGHRGEPGRDRLPRSATGPAHPPAPPGERQTADPGDGLRRHQPRYPPGQPR
ncbi:ISAs1 family transposase [Streptomyces mirabilis]